MLIFGRLSSAKTSPNGWNSFSTWQSQDALKTKPSVGGDAPVSNQLTRSCLIRSPGVSFHKKGEAKASRKVCPSLEISSLTNLPVNTMVCHKSRRSQSGNRHGEPSTNLEYNSLSIWPIMYGLLWIDDALPVSFWEDNSRDDNRLTIGLGGLNQPWISPHCYPNTNPVVPILCKMEQIQHLLSQGKGEIFTLLKMKILRIILNPKTEF